MATLTICDLDDNLKQRLRVQAAGNNRCMEEAARQILRSALADTGAASAAVDAQIAAIAVARQPGLVVRSVTDFEDNGLVVIKPWAPP